VCSLASPPKQLHSAVDTVAISVIYLTMCLSGVRTNRPCCNLLCWCLVIIVDLGFCPNRLDLEYRWTSLESCVSHWPSTHGEDLCLSWTHSQPGQTAQLTSEQWRFHVLNKERTLSTSPCCLKPSIESHHHFRLSVTCLLPSRSHTSLQAWTNSNLFQSCRSQKCCLITQP